MRFLIVRERILVVIKLLIKTSLMLFLIMVLVMINGYLSKANGSEKEGEKTIVKKGDKVKIHYTVSLKDGTVFDKSKAGKPLEFTVGSEQMPRGLDLAVRGMKLNEEKKVTIEAKDAYGKRNEDLVMKFFRTDLPENFEPRKGMVIKLQGIPGTIVNIDETHVILDGNHPLAGKDVVFDINVVGIE
ncbi:MAG: peptidylprolyl isomerase [Candidatus Scalindua rubra]|uniref:Peptidyl-prolyl cis-trans isomerase n=1 Tax=Candidatus Scalindua rubra TaxID=1872076 RepID=A0A1E3XDP0_9BACT|nr:MAG: peptidylprolyl isomerase [Candidatus Scalindua rubra]